MKGHQAYMEISKHFITAAKKLADSAVHVPDVVLFLSYHSFESAISAYIQFRDRGVPRSHTKKFDEFILLIRNEPANFKRPIAPGNV